MKRWGAAVSSNHIMLKDKITKILSICLLGVCGYMLINAAAGIIEKQLVFPPYKVKAADFHENTAQLYEKKAYDLCSKDWQKCIDTYTIAMKLGKADNVSYFNRAVAYARLGKYYEAIADYTKALNLKKDAVAYTCRGINYTRVGRDPEALVDFDKAIGIDPALADTYTMRGAIYKKRNNFGPALADYAKACSLGQKDGCGELENGNILFWLFRDKYEPGVNQNLPLSLKEVVGAPSQGAGKTVFLAYLEYLGGRRKILESRARAIENWDKTAGLKMKGVFLNEMNFGRDGVNAWVPVQEMLFNGRFSALVKGEQVHLMAIHFGDSDEDMLLAIQNIPVD